MLQIMAKTSLVVMVDDPRINQNLGEFLNQVQSGLGQGSSKTGILYPKGAVLLSSNTEEVSR